MAAADELIESIDSLLQPGRLSLSDPADRIAFGCCCFIEKALSDPGWAGVVARMPELSLEIVIGIMLRLTASCAEGKFLRDDRDAAIGAILRAVGLDADQVKASLARLPLADSGVLPQ